MTAIRVLIADDSAVARRQIVQMLEADPELEVAATASTGREALEQAQRLLPDVVVLDLAMPDMNGLEVLKELRRRAPQIPVVMFSALTERNGNVALDALALGAGECITKPSSGGELERPLGSVREQLVAKLKALHLRTQRGQQGPPRPRSLETPPPLPPRPLRVTAVVLGASTGGPAMIPQVLGAFPADFPAPVFIAQHLPPIFSRLLAERLDRVCRLRVSEARDGELVQAGQAWIAPGDQHLALTRERREVKLALQLAAPEDFMHPSVDVLFRSAAAIYGAGVLAVVMTGMGQDGVIGCEAVCQAGGQILVQEPSTCVVAHMPRAVMESGLPYRRVPLRMLGKEIVRRGLRAWDPVPELGGTARRDG